MRFPQSLHPAGWKICDLKFGGARLATTHRDTFAEEIRNQGIDGLIDMLSNKSRQNGTWPESVGSRESPEKRRRGGRGEEARPVTRGGNSNRP